MTNYLSPSCFIFWMDFEHAIILTPCAPQLFDDNLDVCAKQRIFGTPQIIPFLARGHTILEKALLWGRCNGKLLKMSENVQSVAVKQESYSFKSLRPRRRIFTECLLSVIKRSQLYFYCPNLVKQFSGVKTEEQQGADGGGWGPFWALMLQAGSHNGGA